MATITDNDLALFRERAKTELKSTGDIGRLAWDDVVEALCKEVARLRSVSKERGDCAKLREDLGSLECQVKPLSLDDAISHADEVAGDCSTFCKREHKQLANWLRELKNRRNGSGNAAKLREALKHVLDAIKNISRTHNSDLPPDVQAVLGDIAYTASTALSVKAPSK